MGITVCGRNRILQICACRLIGGDEYLILWADLDWLLYALVICPTIGSGSFIYSAYSCYEVVFESLDGSLWIFCPVITWGTNWYLMSMVIIAILKLLILHYPWNVILSLFRIFSSIQLILGNPVSFPCHFYSFLLTLGWHYHSIHTWLRCIYFLCLMWWGSVSVDLSKFFPPLLY